MYADVYHQPTTIPAQPGYFVTHFCPAGDDDDGPYPAEFIWTKPIVAWLIQPVCDDEKAIERERRGRDEGAPPDILPVSYVETKPVTADGWWPDDYVFGRTFIKHPDGSLSMMGNGDEQSFTDEAAALIGAVKWHEHQEEIKAKMEAVHAKDLKALKEAGRSLLKLRPDDGRNIIARILAAFNGAKRIADLPTYRYDAARRKIVAETKKAEASAAA